MVWTLDPKTQHSMAHVNLDHVMYVIVQRCALSRKPNSFFGL